MSDGRDTPANGRVAVAHLKGQVQAERFVDGAAVQVACFATGLHVAPDGPLARQVLFGDRLAVYERRDGWAFVQVAKDGYCGYVLESVLGTPLIATHAVRLRQTRAYPAAGFKAPPLLRLPFGAQVEVIGSDGRWAEIALPGGPARVPAGHLRSLDDPLPDPAATAALFLGTDYLWAGNTGDGIDCSGLVQAVCLAAGIPCPGDSDQQAQRLGTPLGEHDALQRNDVLFWKSHVALVEGATTMIHATAFTMSVIREDIATAIARIGAAGDGPVTARRRLPAVSFL